MSDFKKKVLVVSSSLVTGGLEKCLINFCDNFDYEKYEVDLYLFNEGRDLLKELNKSVNLLPESPLYYTVYNRSVLKGIFQLLKKGKFGLAAYKLGRFLRVRFKKNTNTVRDWKYMKKTMLEINKEYDVAIGFEEGTSGYYIADCIKAKTKMCWIHTDINEINSNEILDKAAFDNVEYVCTVSVNSLNALIKKYPEHKDKMKCFVLPALLDYKKIDKMANEPCDMRKTGINILSVGRLVELKGFHLCVEPLSRLVKEGYDVKWYVAGDGSDRGMIESEIERCDVEDSFILLGNCANPYSYIKSSDICVQPSRYEGFSVAVWEEKYLKKPVIATTIPSNFELLTDKVNGLLIERDSDSIYNAVKLLLENQQLREKMALTPANNFEQVGNTMAEIEKLF